MWVKVLSWQARRPAFVPWNLREKPDVVCMCDPSIPVESWEVEMGMPPSSPVREPEVRSTSLQKQEGSLPQWWKARTDRQALSSDPHACCD